MMRNFVFSCLVLAHSVHQTFGVRDFSEDKISDVDVTARLTHLNTKLPKAYRCCADGQLLDVDTFYRNNRTWDVSLVLVSVENISCVDSNKALFNFTFDCRRVLDFDASVEDFDEVEFYVENDLVYLGDHHNVKIETSPKRVCFGNRTKGNGLELRALTCLEDIEDDDETGIDTRLAGRLSIVSAPFLVLTIIVYSILPELRDLQGLSILSLCATYTVATIVNANANINFKFRTNDELCRAGGLLLYYSLMSSYFWMSVISIQVFVNAKFPNLVIPWRRQFCWYCGYAWGVPGILLLCVMTAEVAPGSHILPGMGMNYVCWFNGKAARWAYFLIPMTVVFVNSILMFIASAYIIFRQTCAADYKKLRYKFLLSTRLFVVVGITWLFKPIQEAHGKAHIVWKIADCWNILQGVFIFIVLVLLRKRAVLGLMERGYTFCLKSWLQTLVDKLSGDEEPVPLVMNNVDIEVNEIQDEEDSD